MGYNNDNIFFIFFSNKTHGIAPRSSLLFPLIFKTFAFDRPLPRCVRVSADDRPAFSLILERSMGSPYAVRSQRRSRCPSLFRELPAPGIDQSHRSDVPIPIVRLVTLFSNIALANRTVIFGAHVFIFARTNVKACRQHRHQHLVFSPPPRSFYYTILFSLHHKVFRLEEMTLQQDGLSRFQVS